MGSNKNAQPLQLSTTPNDQQQHHCKISMCRKPNRAAGSTQYSSTYPGRASIRVVEAPVIQETCKIFLKGIYLCPVDRLVGELYHVFSRDMLVKELWPALSSSKDELLQSLACVSHSFHSPGCT